MSHEAETARRQREEERRLDHVFVREREHVADRGRTVARESFVQRSEEAVDVAFVHREQQLFLARKIEVDGTFGEARFVRDLGDIRDPVRRAQ